MVGGVVHRGELWEGRMGLAVHFHMVLPFHVDSGVRPRALDGCLVSNREKLDIYCAVSAAVRRATGIPACQPPLDSLGLDWRQMLESRPLVVRAGARCPSL